MSDVVEVNSTTIQSSENTVINKPSSEMSTVEVTTTPPINDVNDETNLTANKNTSEASEDEHNCGVDKTDDKEMTNKTEDLDNTEPDEARPVTEGSEKIDLSAEQDTAEQVAPSSEEPTLVKSSDQADRKHVQDLSENVEQPKHLSPISEPSVGEKMEVSNTAQQEQNQPADTDTLTTDNTHSDEEASCSGTQNDSKPLGPSESIYHIKWTYFKKKLVPIITQNENGPCPLLALMNVLLLQNRVKLTQDTEIISANQLMVYLGDCVLENVPGDEGVSTPSRLNFEQNMSDAMSVMPKLQTGLDVNVKFTGVSHFEYTSECIIFDLLQIALYHGWLVDPQNAAEVEAVGKCSYNQLVEKIITDKTSDQPEAVNQALIAEQFLALSASQLTYHGLSELSSNVKEDELAVLFRNNHFTTLYRQKNELFQLVTDQGFLNENNVVWETLSNVEGDCHFVDSEFRTYTKPEPSLQPVEPSNIPLNSEEQIDQDYLVALSLQQEQQQEPIPWAQQAGPPMSDLELAQTLQEEERRAAAEEAQRQEHQQQMQGRNGAQAAGVQRRQGRPNTDSREREEKKSDCHIL